MTHARLVTALASGLTLALTAVAAPRMALAQAATGSATERLNILTPEERAAGWRLLFDGHSTTGWRGWKMDTIPSGWGVREGALTRVRPAADIITTEKFKNFELTLEWNVSPKGNSGIFYRVSEDTADGRNAEGYIGLQEHEFRVAFRNIKIRVLP